MEPTEPVAVGSRLTHLKAQEQLDKQPHLHSTSWKEYITKTERLWQKREAGLMQLATVALVGTPVTCIFIETLFITPTILGATTTILSAGIVALLVCVVARAIFEHMKPQLAYKIYEGDFRIPPLVLEKTLPRLADCACKTFIGWMNLLQLSFAYRGLGAERFNKLAKGEDTVALKLWADIEQLTNPKHSLDHVRAELEKYAHNPILTEHTYFFDILGNVLQERNPQVFEQLLPELGKLSTNFKYKTIDTPWGECHLSEKLCGTLAWVDQMTHVSNEKELKCLQRLNCRMTHQHVEWSVSAHLDDIEFALHQGDLKLAKEVAFGADLYAEWTFEEHKRFVDLGNRYPFWELLDKAKENLVENYLEGDWIADLKFAEDYLLPTLKADLLTKARDKFAERPKDAEEWLVRVLNLLPHEDRAAFFQDNAAFITAPACFGKIYVRAKQEDAVALKTLCDAFLRRQSDIYLISVWGIDGMRQVREELKKTHNPKTPFPGLLGEKVVNLLSTSVQALQTRRTNLIHRFTQTRTARAVYMTVNVVATVAIFLNPYTPALVSIAAAITHAWQFKRIHGALWNIPFNTLLHRIPLEVAEKKRSILNNFRQARLTTAEIEEGFSGLTDPARRELLVEMDFAQLMAARRFLGEVKFKLLIRGLHSFGLKLFEEYEAVLTLESAEEMQKRVFLLAMEGALREQIAFFTCLIQKVQGKYPELTILSNFPFLKKEVDGRLGMRLRYVDIPWQTEEWIEDFKAAKKEEHLHILFEQLRPRSLNVVELKAIAEALAEKNYQSPRRACFDHYLEDKCQIASQKWHEQLAFANLYKLEDLKGRLARIKIEQVQKKTLNETWKELTDALPVKQREEVLSAITWTASMAKHCVEWLQEMAPEEKSETRVSLQKRVGAWIKTQSEEGLATAWGLKQYNDYLIWARGV